MEAGPSSSRASNVPSLQEFFLQGSILDTHCEILLHRLRGLCDNADEPPETFHDHELIFQIRGPTGSPFVLRARQALDHPELPWHVRYLGQPEVDKNRPTMIRSCIDSGVSDNIVQFLQELGFKIDHEMVLKGFMFRKGRMKVTVTKVCRVLQPGNVEAIEPVSQSYFVELSVIGTSGQEALGDDMKLFAEQLKPLVHLEKVDHRRLLYG